MTPAQIVIAGLLISTAIPSLTPQALDTGSAAVTVPSATAAVDTVEIAKSQAEILKDRTYGSQSKDPKTIDCVEFVNAVLEECCKAAGKADKFTAEIRSRVAIATLDAKEDLQALVAEAKDDRIKGVQWALTAAGLGEAVPVEQAKAGDFVQYWYKHDDKWQGHSGVILSIESGSAVLIGSHRTVLASEKDKAVQDRKGGVGESTPIKLDDPAKKVFVVRWKQ